MNKNYYSLLFMRVIRTAISIFTESFLVLYFFKLSNNNILPIGLYNLFKYTIMALIIFAVRNITKNKNRIFLLRLSILFNFLFFLLIIILKEKIIKYAVLLGITYGIEEGLYFSVTNIYESEINRKMMAKYTGSFTTIRSIISIIIPVVFGSIMSYKSFNNCVFLVLMLVILNMILSIIYKDKTIPKNNKVNIQKYIKLLKNNKNVLLGHFLALTKGLTFSGAYASLITIYIIKVFDTGFKLGIFTSIFSIITAIASFLFANYIKKKSYKNILLISNILTIFSLILMLFKCNPFTIIVFNFIQSFAKTYILLIDTTNTLILSNISIIKEQFKEEYFLFNEIFIFLGRLLSYTIFCALAFVKNNICTNIIMIIFILFVIIRMYYSLNVEKITTLDYNK